MAADCEWLSDARRWTEVTEGLVQLLLPLLLLPLLMALSSERGEREPSVMGTGAAHATVDVAATAAAMEAAAAVAAAAAAAAAVAGGDPLDMQAGREGSERAEMGAHAATAHHR